MSRVSLWKRPALVAGFVGFGLAAAISAASAASFGTSVRIDGPQSLIVEAQSRACRACRNSCTRDYKYRCGYSESCRAGFTGCMRECWYEVCR